MVCISEVLKFLADSPRKTHAIELVDPFNTTHQIIIPLQLSGVTIFYVYSPTIAEYEDEDIPKIHLAAEEPPWDPSTKNTQKERLNF